MTLEKFADTLQGRIKAQLAETNPATDNIVAIGQTLTLIRNVIRELRDFTGAYKFTAEVEEIKFFKEIKPVFLSQYFYHRRVFEIRLFDSFRDLKSRQVNYYQLLKKLESFAVKNQSFYEYCMTNSTYLDKQYFVRGRRDDKVIDRDEKFSTGYDSKLGKILANELLKKFILDSLQQSQSAEQPGSLTWTGSKTDLIELIYALHAVKAFNDGLTDIKDIATALERGFNVSLGKYYRSWQDIRLRKIARTAFLDKLKERLIIRMNEE